VPSEAVLQVLGQQQPAAGLGRGSQDDGTAEPQSLVGLQVKGVDHDAGGGLAHCGCIRQPRIAVRVSRATFTAGPGRAHFWTMSRW
jgi:hypothetical protein